MKAIRRKSDHIVQYMIGDTDLVELNDRGLHTISMRAIDIKPDTHEIVEGVPAPDLFVGGAMSWNGAWSITNQTAYDEAVEARKQQARSEMVVTRTQLTIVLAAQGVITPEEAEAWVGGTSLPAIATNAISASDLTDAEKLAARIKALGSQNIRRDNPLVAMLKEAVPLSDDATDALFQAAASID